MIHSFFLKQTDWENILGENQEVLQKIKFKKKIKIFKEMEKI